jgi:hypothetical protein
MTQGEKPDPERIAMIEREKAAGCGCHHHAALRAAEEARDKWKGRAGYLGGMRVELAEQLAAVTARAEKAEEAVRACRNAMERMVFDAGDQYAEDMYHEACNLSDAALASAPAEKR